MESLRRLAGTDLNLLVVFRAIDETRQVTAAARQLGVSQPALSHSLNRLRAMLGDRLFVKTPAGMVPTPRARALSAPVRELLAQVEQTVLQAQAFAPESLQRTFRIRTTDWLEAMLVPTMAKTLAAAPGVQLGLQGAGFSLPQAELESGACDLAIAGFFGKPPAGFYQQKLFTDHFACAARVDHPALKNARGLSLDVFCRERHVLIAPGGELSGRVDRELRRLKRQRTIVAGVSSFLSSLWIVAETDCLITAPSRLLERFAPQVGLKLFTPPLPVPPVSVVQVWHERNHRDPAHRWLRESVFQSLTE